MTTRCHHLSHRACLGGEGDGWRGDDLSEPHGIFSVLVKESLAVRIRSLAKSSSEWWMHLSFLICKKEHTNRNLLLGVIGRITVKDLPLILWACVLASPLSAATTCIVVSPKHRPQSAGTDTP